MDALYQTLQQSWLANYMLGWVWAWPVAETIHFFGMSILIGAIALTDLRLLGFFKRMAIQSTHVLIYIAIIGFVLNLLTGIMFFVAEPWHFTYATSFQWKMLFVLLAGINAAYFTFALMPTWNEWDPHGNPPLAARISGGLSLAFWFLVVIFGRMIEYL